MSISRRLALACFSIAACFAPALSQAQTFQSPAETSLPSYILVVGKSTDRTKIGAYAASLPPIYASHNAYYLAIGGPGRGINWIEGPWQDRSIILGKFPSANEVNSFWWGPAYREAIRKRDAAGVFSVVTVNGSVPSQFEGPTAGFLIVMTGLRDASTTQEARSERAFQSLREGVLGSGGVLLNDGASGAFISLEGDTVFNRFTIAVWPSIAARDRYLASSNGKRAARLRMDLGISAVATANGVPRNQLPPAAAQPTQR